MKTFTRWLLLALLLVATPMLALVELASANTELVPASRLVAPYWDVTDARSTLFLLVNASKSVELRSFPLTGAPQVAGVHVEFYDKTCSRKDVTIELSESDIDQLDLKSLPDLRGATATLPSKIGWADIDVRAGDAQRDKDSIQCNVLMGTVVNSDSAGDFAIAYPMASSIGTSRTGDTRTSGSDLCTASAPIVRHDSNGKAVAGSWTGQYEPFPSRVFVPFFFAEGGPSGMKSQLVLAAPADGNWHNNGNGESPGQALPGIPPAEPQAGFLMSGTGLVYDGCENKESYSFGGHYINAALSALFDTKLIQELPWKLPGGAFCKSPGNFPSVDDDYSGAFVGWVDLPNALPDKSANPRGMVGILIQNTTVTATSARKQGDVVRLWGDPADGGRAGTYTLVDDVDHGDLN